MKILSQEDLATLSVLFALPTNEALTQGDQFFRTHKFTATDIQESLSHLRETDGKKGFIQYVLINYQLPPMSPAPIRVRDYDDAALFLAHKIDIAKQRAIADILLTCNLYAVTNKHHIAYILATAKGESQFTPQREKGGLKYEFEAKKKQSYNRPIMGNIPCGDSLVTQGHIPPNKPQIRALYNSTVWPKADYDKRPAAFKQGVETCYFHKYDGRGYVQLTYHDNYKKMGPFIEGDLVANPDLALDPKNAAKILVIGMKNGLFTGKSLSKYDRKNGSFNSREARRIINGVDKQDKFAYWEQIYFKKMQSPFH
ncbi:hypothetical protein GO730_28330 [Spirosoma sp. HMF3257]|uniref:Glycoside hydrolase family 19 catalytic domain-containing protein n=1 Tax=Spirosoma telluris TaxID=2183553 RepID=A0A327NRP3_9BACT|nr:hypothetical protein [Spirosoma telluris]RAI77109.1 hypothetical protein HMF3257_28275 [Spirosoma telluris]